MRLKGKLVSVKVFGNPFECYEAIGNWLANAAPEPWEQITVTFEIIAIDEASEECIWYIPKNNPTGEGQFFIHDSSFVRCFHQLAHLTSTLEKGFYKQCTFTLFADGTYKTQYEYP